MEDELSERARGWAATMAGHDSPAGAIRYAHAGAPVPLGARPALSREAREARESAQLAPGAARALGAGERARPEAPDPCRTCFQRDHDRVLHSAAFRRLAGKTQVFIFPTDHQRTRLTHALEVAQVAEAIARAAGLNVDLAVAAALAHDVGHGPGGHPSEDAFAQYLDEGFDHAPWGADVVLAPLNLCAPTLDAVRNHSWSRPAPGTAEGEVVAWADRIAYVCHDWEDAIAAGIVTDQDLPPLVAQRCGTRRAQQIGAFISGVLDAVAQTGTVGMTVELAEALAAFRQGNYERIYLRPDSLEQGRRVRRLLEALVERYAAAPELLPRDFAAADGAGSVAAFRAAVGYVAGMTDRYALRCARQLLDWPDDELPTGLHEATG